MNNTSEQNVAVVGGGYWGRNLVRNFYELGALQAVCDLSKDTREELAGKYPGLKLTDNYDSILNDNSIKGVVLATPAVQHYPMAKQALEAGKDVLVEKPLALTVAEGEELVQLAQAKNRVLMVGHILEYHPAVKKLVELVSTGQLGKILYIYSNRLNMGKIRTEENILWSFAPHDISVIIRLLGELPVAVSANGSAYINPDVADVTLTNLYFNSKVQAHIYVSWLHPFKEQKLVIVGNEKMAVFNDTAEDKLLLYNHRVNWVDHCPVAAKGDAEVVALEKKEPLKEECLHFLESMRDRKTPLTGPQNALDVLKVLSASQKSLEQDGQRINVETSNKNQVYYVHPTSIVEKGAKLGEGTKVWHFSHIMPDAQLGKNCNLGQNVFIGKGVEAGDNVKIQNNVSVYEGVILEDNVFCGPSCVFTNIKTPRSAYPRNTKDDYIVTRVKEGASIGANATIVCGITIGKHALIGAGAVVTKDVPDQAVVYGNPAEVKGWSCECGQVMVESEATYIECKSCGVKNY